MGYGGTVLQDSFLTYYKGTKEKAVTMLYGLLSASWLT